MKASFSRLSLLSFLLLSACSSYYYQITDPASGRIYLSSEYDQRRNGSITFKDAVSQSVVTLQSSEVREISKEEFETNRSTPN